MNKLFFFFVLTFFNVIISAQTFTVSYGFANVTTSSGSIDPTPIPTITGLQFSAFSANGVSSNPNATARFTFTNWPNGSTNTIDTYSTFTGVFTPTAYYEVSITPQINYTLNLNTINFAMRRSGTGIRNYSIRSNIDNFATNLPASIGTNTNLSVLSSNVFFWNFDATSTASDQYGSSIQLPAASFSSCSTPVIFRFYAWNSEAITGTFSIDSVVFIGSRSSGTLTPPPPTSYKCVNKVCVLDANGTYSTLTLCQVSNCGGVGFNENSLQNTLFIYPNPYNDGLLNITSEKENFKIEIINPMGQIIFTQCNLNKESAIKLNLSHLAGGAYLIKCYAENEMQIKKLLILK